MAAVLIVVAALIAGGAGYVLGKSRAQHPEACWERIRAAEERAERWANRAAELKGQLAELEHGSTFTVGFLLSEIDKVGGYAPAPLALERR